MSAARLPADTRRALAEAARLVGPDDTLWPGLVERALPEALYPASSHGRLSRRRDVRALREGRLETIARLD